MEKSDITSLQAMVGTKHQELYPSHRSTFLGLALAGEVGELCNLLKKEERDSADHSKAIKAEMADVLVYLLILAHDREITINELMIEARSKHLRFIQKIHVDLFREREGDRVAMNVCLPMHRVDPNCCPEGWDLIGINRLGETYMMESDGQWKLIRSSSWVEGS